jgi:hypothetical protein
MSIRNTSTGGWARATKSRDSSRRRIRVPAVEAMRIWKEISLWKREFIGSTPKVRGGGVGGASGLVLYAVVFVLRGIILEFLIRDSRIVGFLFLLGSEQRSGDLDKLSN